MGIVLGRSVTHLPPPAFLTSRIRLLEEKEDEFAMLEIDGRVA